MPNICHNAGQMQNDVFGSHGLHTCRIATYATNHLANNGSTNL